ncbi:MAG: hypothetical protein QW057_01690 [Candidatus Bathyarchaeia archaeon]
MNDVVPTSTVYFSILPFLVIGAIVLGVLFLVLLVILVARGSQVSRMTGGAVTLALASIIFLTGVWCFALSPTSTQYENVLSAGPSILPGRSWTYNASFAQGDTITGNVNLRDFWPKPLDEELNRTLPDVDLNGTQAGGVVLEPVPRPIIVAQTFSLFLYDPQGETVLSELNTSSAYFTVKASRTGLYRFKVMNDGPRTAVLSVNISKSTQYRPLEPFGQWLSLISLPLIGLGIWAALSKPRLHREVERAA